MIRNKGIKRECEHTKTLGLTCFWYKISHLSCSFVKGDMSNTCKQCIKAPVECYTTVSEQGNQNDLNESKNDPTIKSSIKTDWFLKPDSSAEAAAWCIVQKLHKSEFNSKHGIIITIDSASGNDKVPNNSLRKVLHNFFGETVAGGGGARKMLHEHQAYGNGSGTTSVGIPDTCVFHIIDLFFLQQYDLKS